MKHRINYIWVLIKRTFTKFQDDNAFQFGAALSYYTIFSLTPILIIVIAVAGAIFGEEAAAGEIFAELDNLLGKDGALQIQSMIEKGSELKKHGIAKFIALFTLFLSATGVFISLQDSLNYIWCVKVKPKNSFLKLIIDRILSFGMVVSISFLLLVSLVVNAGLVAFSRLISRYFNDSLVILVEALSFLISIGIITLLFALIFKILPDVKIKWKNVWMGSFVTSLLFTLGKFLIGLYLGHSDITSTYGAAGTIIVLLTWIFYSSLLLFLGAEFTQVLSIKEEVKIEPVEYAVKVKNETKEITKPSDTKIK